jgi:hypothetical protein
VITPSGAQALGAGGRWVPGSALMNLRLLQTMAQEAGVPGTTRFVVNLPQGVTNGSADD